MKSTNSVLSNIERMQSQIRKGINCARRIVPPRKDLLEKTSGDLRGHSFHNCYVDLLLCLHKNPDRNILSQDSSNVLCGHLSWKRFTIISLWKRASSSSKMQIGKFLKDTNCGGVYNSYIALRDFWKANMGKTSSPLIPYCKLLCHGCFLGLSLLKNSEAVQLFMTIIDPVEPNKKRPSETGPSVWSLRWQD